MKRFDLNKRLANFVRVKRGDLSFVQFEKKFGISSSSVSRIESEEQNVTLKTLEDLCIAFKCDVEELFPE